jgi:hypothetical protein
MGTDEDNLKKKQDKMAKLEKKRIKAQIKLEKKRRKELNEPEVQKEERGMAVDEGLDARTAVSQSNRKDSISNTNEVESVPWYKNPDWIRAIAGIASLIVAIIAILITLYM